MSHDPLLMLGAGVLYLIAGFVFFDNPKTFRVVAFTVITAGVASLFLFRSDLVAGAASGIARAIGS